MVARSAAAFSAYIALFAFSTLAGIIFAQDELIWVDVGNYTSRDNPTYASDEQPIEPPKLEGEGIQHSPKLAEELEIAKTDALLLYTEYSSKTGSDLKDFLKNVSNFTDDAVRSINASGTREEAECRELFDKRLHKIENDAQRAALFSGENHHKFLLGHMIVFRMHLNKSEDYIKKCDNAVKSCGESCETIPRVKRWRRLAAEEIHRVRDDLQHSRRSYRDLVTHGRRKLNHLRKQIIVRTKSAVEMYNDCVRKG